MKRSNLNKTHDIRRGGHPPVLITPLGKSFDDVRLVAHESEQAHDLLATRPNAPQHVTLLCFFENQDELVDRVDLVFNALDKRTKRIGYVVNKSV